MYQINEFFHGTEEEALDMVGLYTYSESLLHRTWCHGDILGATGGEEFIHDQRVSGQ